ncbi:MAG: hypothetical protein LPK03_06605 [Pontibacter sp.]|nr:hypothetical protein [Pontibacter sp.]
MAGEKEQSKPARNILTLEQVELLELYLQKLDTIYEELKMAEKVHVQIETEHLKKILHQ